MKTVFIAAAVIAHPGSGVIIRQTAHVCSYRGVAEGVYFGCFDRGCMEVEVLSDSVMHAGILGKFDEETLQVFFPRLEYRFDESSCRLHVVENPLFLTHGFAYDFDSDQEYAVKGAQAYLRLLSGRTDSSVLIPEMDASASWEFVGDGIKVLGKELVLKPREPRQIWLETARELKWTLSEANAIALTRSPIDSFDRVHKGALSFSGACVYSRIPPGFYLGYLTPEWMIEIGVVDRNEMRLEIASLLSSKSLKFRSYFSFDSNTCMFNLPKSMLLQLEKGMQTLAEAEDSAELLARSQLAKNGIVSRHGTIRMMGSLLVVHPTKVDLRARLSQQRPCRLNRDWGVYYGCLANRQVCMQLRLTSHAATVEVLTAQTNERSPLFFSFPRVPHQFDAHKCEIDLTHTNETGGSVGFVHDLLSLGFEFLRSTTDMEVILRSDMVQGLIGKIDSTGSIKLLGIDLRERAAKTRVPWDKVMGTMSSGKKVMVSSRNVEFFTSKELLNPIKLGSSLASTAPTCLVERLAGGFYAGCLGSACLELHLDVAKKTASVKILSGQEFYYLPVVGIGFDPDTCALSLGKTQEMGLKYEMDSNSLNRFDKEWAGASGYLVRDAMNLLGINLYLEPHDGIKWIEVLQKRMHLSGENEAFFSRSFDSNLKLLERPNM